MSNSFMGLLNRLVILSDFLLQEGVDIGAVSIFDNTRCPNGVRKNKRQLYRR